MDDQNISDSQRDESDSVDRPEALGDHDEPPAGGDEAGDDLPHGPRRSGIQRPWEALEQLDRQWEDLTPIAGRTGSITALALTTDGDPRGWDYLGALTGAPPNETAAACEAWLEAQLAADAASLDRTLRPHVELVPAGRLWFVVRTIADIIVVIDGPGFLTPRTAAVAASRRYHAELLRALERTGVADVTDADDVSDNTDPGDAPPEVDADPTSGVPEA